MTPTTRLDTAALAERVEALEYEALGPTLVAELVAALRAGERLREALTEILLPSAWQEHPSGLLITGLSPEHMARLRAALADAESGRPEPTPATSELAEGAARVKAIDGKIIVPKPGGGPYDPWEDSL